MQRTGFLPPLAPLLRAHLCDLGEFGKGALVGEHEGLTDSLDAACGSSGPRQNQQEALLSEYVRQVTLWTSVIFIKWSREWIDGLRGILSKMTAPVFNYRLRLGLRIQGWGGG